MQSSDKNMLPLDFDEEKYLELNPDVKIAGQDAIKHYLEFGYKEHRIWKTAYDRSQLPNDFNALVYQALHNDVKEAGIDPAEHYVRYGIKEKRQYKLEHRNQLPDDFDPITYRSLYKDIDNSGTDPVLHYLNHGQAEGRVYNLNFQSKRQSKTKPIFFLHIPKTAGSSVNEYAKKRMMCAFHIESSPQFYRAIDEGTANFDFVSGHLAYTNSLSVIHDDNWFRFTFLRSPIYQTISHIKWVRSFSTPERAHEVIVYSDEEKKLFKELQDISLEDIDKLEYLRDNNLQFRKYFDNCQVRYLSDPDCQVVTIKNYNEASNNIRKLNYIGLCETASADSLSVFQEAGWEATYESFPETNPSPSQEMPNLNDLRVLEYYQSLTFYDAKLYKEQLVFRQNNKGP